MTRRYFPIFWDTSSDPALVVGGQEDAARKVRLLLKAGSAVRVVARTANQELQDLSATGAIELHRRPVSEADIAAAGLVISATAQDQADRFVSATARAHGKQVNVVDRPDLSTFTVPSIVDRSPVLVAISTAGTAPVLGRRIRAQIEAALSPNLGRLARFAASLRDDVQAKVNAPAGRRRFWERFFDSDAAEKALNGDDDNARTDAYEQIAAAATPDARQAGRVVLVGAGPGAADLLTLRALRALQQADIIIFDALVGPEVLDLARRDARRLYVGKLKGRHSYSQERINGILIDEAKRGSVVVRLKGGDPFVFGRGGEEVRALRDAGIAVDVIPGITAATGAAAAIGLPLTHRNHANIVSFATGHPAAGGEAPDFAPLADPKQTAVIYMGKTRAGEISSALIDLGRRSDTPVAIIENATLPEQRTLVGTLGNLPLVADVHGLNGPTLIVVGDAVSEADLTRAERLQDAAAPLPLKTVA